MKKKLTVEQIDDIQTCLNNNGGILEIKEKSSEYTGVNYEVRIKDNPYVESLYHPINLTKEYIEMIKSVVGDNVDFNNTRTVFWLL